MEVKELEDQKPPEGYPIHPFAQAMPEMPESEFTLFKEDVRRNDQLQPILILDGMVLDGRHRQRAALELGIEPRYALLSEDTDPLPIVASGNRFRRNSTLGQMAIAAVKVYLISNGLDWSGKQHVENSGSDFAILQTEPLTQDEVAEMFGLSKRLFSHAVRLFEPESNASASLKLAAEQALLTVSDASKIVDEPEHIQDAAVDLVRQKKVRTVSAAVSRVPRDKDQPAVVDTPILESCRSTDGSITLHHRAIEDLRELVPPESVNVIITGVPGGDGASRTLKELASFAVHALKPDGGLLLLCPSPRLPQVVGSLRHRALTFLLEIDYRIDVPVRKLDERHGVGIRRVPLLVYGKPEFLLADGGDVIQLPEVDGDSAGVNIRQRHAVGTELIVRRFTQPGDMVSDPLLLSETHAALAAFRLGRGFLGASHDGRLFQHVRDRLIREAGLSAFQAE